MASFVAPILGGLAGLFGGNSTKQTNTTSSQTGTQNQNYSNTGSTTPNLNPFQQQLAQMFSQGAMQQFQNGTNMAPYTSQGLQQIQGQSTANSKAIANNLAARGLSYSPAAATAMTQNTVNSGNQAQTFLQGVPLLQHQLQQGNLQQLMQAFSTQPTGVTTTGSGTGSGTSTTNGTQQSTTSTPGGGLAGLLSGFASLFGLGGGSGSGGGGISSSSSGGVPNSGWSLSG